MSLAITGYRVFIASPGGLQQERVIFRKCIVEANENAVQRGALFLPVGWEDTLGGVGRPQEIINSDLQACDYFVLLLADRWGTPTSKDEESEYSSGTEEEFRQALRYSEDPGRPLRHIVACFKAVSPDKLADPGPQLRRVLDFKRELEATKRILFHTFDESSDFESILRRFLARWLLDHDRGVNRKGTTLPLSGPGSPLSVSTAPPSRDGLPVDDLKDTLDEADRLADQGFSTDAEAIYARAITKYRDPNAFNRYGAFLLRSNRLSQAKVMFEHVAVLASEFGEKWRSMALINMGLLCRMQFDLRGAEAMYKDALEIDRKLKRDRGIATALNHLGSIAQIQGELKEAESLYEQAMDVAERAQWLRGIAIEHCSLGMLYLKRGNLEGAKRSMRKALALERRLGRLEGVAEAASGLGLIHQTEGDLVNAERMHREALDINEQLGRVSAAGDQYANLGVIQLKKGDLAAAEALLKTALEWAERSDRPASTANAYAYLGLVYKEAGDLDRAEQAHLDALHIYEELGLRPSTADQYGHLGTVYEQRGDFPKALSNWQRASQLYMETQQPEQAALVDSWAAAAKR